MNQLQHKAAQAVSNLKAARTPMEKAHALGEAIAVKSEISKAQTDEAALALFKAAKPKNSAGMYKDVVRDHPIFMTLPSQKRITSPVALPDGTRAIPNPQGQIAVEPRFLAQMLARGYVRANSVTTNLTPTIQDPPRENV